jgi:phospholipid N-methyltransferase
MITDASNSTTRTMTGIVNTEGDQKIIEYGANLQANDRMVLIDEFGELCIIILRV